jgi:hypothetical protein
MNYSRSTYMNAGILKTIAGTLTVSKAVCDINVSMIRITALSVAFS